MSAGAPCSSAFRDAWDCRSPACARSRLTAARGLDRGVTQYGDREFARYLRRSFAKSMGYSDEMLARLYRLYRVDFRELGYPKELT